VYAPFSPLPLLARLRTFTALTYSPTAPAEVGARALALAGWVNNAVDGVACASASSTSGSSGCSAQWGVGGLDTLPPRVRADVVQRLADLSSRHEKGCAWRVCATPATAVAQLRRLVHPLVSASLGPLARALHVRSLGPVATQWASPLSEDQIGALAKALARTGVQAEPLALVLALFGWYPYDPAAPADHVAPATVPGTAAATDIVACRLCRRRVGLWLFAEGRGRTLDVHAEHLWWCPLADGGWWVDCPLLSSAPPQRLAIAYRPTKRRRRAIPTTAAAPGLPTSTPAPATATLTPVA
jgi:hypothetical protein